MIALVDYGAGNLTSVRKALSALGAEFSTPTAAVDLVSVRGIIVPGVGHFGATRAINEEWRIAIRHALDRGAALFGVCLGMQWLYEASDEAPGLHGLGAFAGRCAILPRRNSRDVPHPTSSVALKVPHVGWNALSQPRSSALMTGVAPEAQVYFTHSYVAPISSATVAITTYGVPFTSAVQRDRISGVQFHPEKSGDVGLRVLRNWLDAL